MLGPLPAQDLPATPSENITPFRVDLFRQGLGCPLKTGLRSLISRGWRRGVIGACVRPGRGLKTRRSPRVRADTSELDTGV